MKVEMRGKYILVIPQKIEDQVKSDSLIILPDDKEMRAVPRGTVEDVGKDVREVCSGDFIWYDATGHVVMEDSLIIMEEDVLGVERNG